jgi:methionyl-tRNA formyltransferase
MNKPHFIFFGTSGYSVIVLQTLKRANMTPSLVVTTPDKPQGRGMTLTPPPTKIWAMENNVPVLQPEKLKDPAFIQKINEIKAEVFIVVAYGKIIPQEVLDIPAFGALNIHASLLPKLRGASPIETAILEDEQNTGVTIMKLDAEMDHGPIVAQKKVELAEWPPQASDLGTAIVELGANLLVEILPKWLSGNITPVEQDHAQATYTRKIEKNDGLIDLNDDPYKNYLKIQAFHKWPTTYFFAEKKNPPSRGSGQLRQSFSEASETKKIRVIIKKAVYKDGTLEIIRVVPEGKREMDYKDFVKSL